MKRLLLDTSSEYMSFVIADDNKLLAYSKSYADRFMSERILVEFDCLLKSASIDGDDIDEFIVVTGPGSFTGVRIGVAFILGLSSATGRCSFGISSLDALALSVASGSFTVASRVKDNIFAFKDYDFDNGVFSDIRFGDEVDFDKQATLTINSFDNDRLSLDMIYKKIDRYRELLSNSEPLYLRKAEAEISFDKKGNIS